MKTLFLVLLICVSLLRAAGAAETNAPADFRSVLSRAALSDDVATQIELVRQLVGSGDELVSRALAAWRVGELYVFTSADGATKTAFLLDAQQDNDGKAKGINVADGQFLKDAAGNPAFFLASEQTAVDTDSSTLR